MLDVAVIGCGIVGANVAYLLSQHKLRAAVFEKENDVSMGTTRANSAIVHAGYDPEPGTAMARLNVRGSALTKEQCAAFDDTAPLCAAMRSIPMPEQGTAYEPLRS